MSYIDGFVVPVPTENKAAYKKVAKAAAKLFKEHGAEKVVECWGDTVPDGKVTSFPMAVKLKKSESVVFSWIVWPNKRTRDKGMKKAMQDPRMQPGQMAMPFDGKRLIMGGFKVLMED